MSIAFVDPNLKNLLAEPGTAAFVAWIDANNGLNEELVETYLATKSEGAELFSTFEAEEMSEMGANDFVVNFENNAEDTIDVVFQGFSASFRFNKLPKLKVQTVNNIIEQLQIAVSNDTDQVDRFADLSSLDESSSDELFAAGCWIYEVSKHFVDSENKQLNDEYIQFIRVASLVHLQLFILASNKLQKDEMGGISDDLQCARNAFGTVLVNI